MLVALAKDLPNVVLHRQAAEFELQAVWLANPSDHGDARLDHAVVELHLRINVCLQQLGVELLHVDLGVPGLAAVHQVVHEVPGLPDGWHVGRLGVQRPADERRHRVEPPRVEDLGLGGARLGVLVLDGDLLAAALGLHAGDPELPHAPHVLRARAVEVLARAGRIGVLQPRSVHLVTRVIREFDDKLLPAVDRPAIHDRVGALQAGRAREDVRHGLHRGRLHRARRAQPRRRRCGGPPEEAAATAQEGGHDSSSLGGECCKCCTVLKGT
mmetsp:Transcript_97994/g.263301  ORF Transcript_97994/g.263301 Transcript_97994/m.263301 type:complete len:270 (+) Transcript_97994:407-1216(+)